MLPEQSYRGICLDKSFIRRYDFLDSFCSVKNIEVSADHPTMQAIDGVLFSKDGKMLVKYPRGRYEQTKRLKEEINHGAYPST